MSFLLQNNRGNKEMENNEEGAKQEENVSLIDYENMNNTKLINGENEKYFRSFIKRKDF